MRKKKKKKANYFPLPLQYGTHLPSFSSREDSIQLFLPSSTRTKGRPNWNTSTSVVMRLTIEPRRTPATAAHSSWSSLPIEFCARKRSLRVLEFAKSTFLWNTEHRTPNKKQGSQGEVCRKIRNSEAFMLNVRVPSAFFLTQAILRESEFLFLDINRCLVYFK